MRINHVIKTDQWRCAPQIRPAPHFVLSRHLYHRRPLRRPSMRDDRRKDRVLVAVKSLGTPDVRSLSVGVLNVRSLGNKSAVSLHTIVNSLDLFVDVET